MTFIEKCLKGDALLDEVDEAIERWHEGLDGTDEELHEYLGMSWNEYSVWMTSPSILSYIVAARHNKRSLEEELDFDKFQMAARARNPDEARKMEFWLKKIGKM